MTYETDGGPQYNLRRDDGTISTFRDGIAHHFVASLATLETTAKNRQPRLQDYYEFRRSALTDAATDRMKRIVFTPGGDARTAAHVVGLLLRDGIEVGRLRQPLTSTIAHSYLGGPGARQTFPAGSYVVDLAQPQRRLAKAVLEPQSGFDRGFVERELGKYQRNRRRGDAGEREEYGFYDVTAWALPYTFNLQAWWTEDAAPLAADAVTDTVLPAPPAPARAASTYVFTDDNAGAARLALALQAEGFKLAVALKPLRADGRSWPRGTFVARVQRNPAALQERLAALAPPLGVAVTPVQSAFADSGDVGRYNVLFIPDGGAGRMRRELGDDGIQKVKAWVGSGGVLIGFGGGGELAAMKEVGLSSVVLVGADTAAKPDSTAKGDVPPVRSPTAPSREKPEYVPGSIFRAALDRSHWLTAGFEQDELPVFLEGSSFWKPSRAGANPVAFVKDSLTLAGFTWPDNTDRLLKGTVWAVVETQGDGRVVLFAEDPLYRAFWRGTARLVSNAMLIGPNR